MKFVFRKATMDDVIKITEVMKNNRYMGCEWSLSNIILWSDYYHMEYTIVDRVFLAKITDEDGKIRLTYPIGAENEKIERRIFDMELEYFKEVGQPQCFGLIDGRMWENINKWYPNQFQIQWNRDFADYIYQRERLASLAGKKLHGKRNHIKRFMEQHPEWIYETITDANVEECVSMAKDWCRKNCRQEDDEKEEESHLVVQALRNRENLHMTGGLLRTKEGVVAFTLGCPIDEDTFDVNFEKAYSEIQGAYPMINQQFVLHELSDYTYVNREEDMGVEGLRKAKLSYYPELLLEKGVVLPKHG